MTLEDILSYIVLDNIPQYHILLSQEWALADDFTLNLKKLKAF